MMMIVKAGCFVPVKRLAVKIVFAVTCSVSSKFSYECLFYDELFVFIITFIRHIYVP